MIILINIPDHLPLPYFELFQETAAGTIKGMIWDDEDRAWCYDLGGAEIYSERSLLRLIQQSHTLQLTKSKD
jgi:hypothetical protein